MARRIPVLGVVAGEAADIITQTAAGEVAIPGDTDSVAAAMTRMRARIEAGEEFGIESAGRSEPARLGGSECFGGRNGAHIRTAP